MIMRCFPRVLVLSLLFLLVGCGQTVTVAVDPTVTMTSAATATSAPAATATALPPTATSAPTAGVCNAADFSSQIPGGPDSGFQYPPLTYHGPQDAAAGTYRYFMCSSGTPTSILTFLEHAIPMGGWTITNTTSTTLNAVQTSLPQYGLCASVNLTVGSHTGYPGEWDAFFHSPTSNCHP